MSFAFARSVAFGAHVSKAFAQYEAPLCCRFRVHDVHQRFTIADFAL